MGKASPGIHRSLPNILSLSRIAFGVVFFLLFRAAAPWSSLACLALVGLAGATDVLDGRLARRNKIVSTVGKWLDPLSDFTFYFFVYLSFWRAGLMPLVFFILFLGRELLMYSVIRPLSMVRRLDPGAKIPGKVKTIVQGVCSALVLVALLSTQLRLLPARALPVVSFWVLAVPIAMSLVSLYWYIRPLFASLASEPLLASTSGRLILGSVLFFLVLHCLFLVLVTWLFGLDWGRLLAFVVVAVIFHALFMGGLLLVRGEFTLEPSGEPLRVLNLPLILSFMRFSAVPAGVYLFLCLEERPGLVAVLIPFLALIFLSDLFDGILARRLGQTTRIGRILDSSGDYLLAIVLSVVYVLIGWIPVWFMVLVLTRLAVQLAGIVALYILHGYSALRLSFLGKASIFAVFLLYGLELLEYLKVPLIGHPQLLVILEYAAGAILLASLVEKAVFLRRDFRKAPR